MSEKTEAPSEKRLRDAKRQGNVARSRTLSSALATAFGVGALVATLPAGLSQLVGYTRRTFEASGALPGADGALLGAASTMFDLCLPTLAAVCLGGVLGSIVQTGVLFHPDVLQFKPERLSPAEGAKRLFSSRNLAEAVRALLIGSVLLAIAWFVAEGAARAITLLPRAGAAAAFREVWTLGESTLIRALLAAGIAGVLDLLFQRHAHLKSLRMSRDELKREHKESEGDPHHKAMRKAAHRAALNGTAARGVAKANVVLVNPTHVAVALRYDPAEAAAPTIVAKGIDEQAAAIRAQARRLQVPMVKNVPLARALVRFDVGQEIPEELYEAVAVILREVLDAGADDALPGPGVANSHPRSRP